MAGQFVTVVDEVVDSYKEIDIEEAREVDPDVEVGDSLGMMMEAGSFSRIAAQTAKQMDDYLAKLFSITDLKDMINKWR